MINLRLLSLRVFVVFAFFVMVLIGFCWATTAQFTVEAGGELSHPINLVAEDRVLMQFKVVGGVVGAANVVGFSMVFPNGTVKDFGESGDFSYSFVSDAEGEYQLNFMNSDEIDAKLVTLNYEIDHYILGMPQMLFMVILIAVVSLVGVAVFIGLSKKPY
jgi:hypothetical protein